MYVRVGLTNGEILNSDVWPDEQINDFISERGGLLGSGDFAQTRVESVDDALAFLERVLNLALIDHDDGKVSIVVNGETLEYAANEVGWVRIVR